MASEVLKALFTAKETISKTLQGASRSLDQFRGQMHELNGAFGGVVAASSGAENEIEDFSNSMREAKVYASGLGRSLDSARNDFLELAAGEDVTERQMESFTRSMANVNFMSKATSSSMSGLLRSFWSLSSAADITDRQMKSLRNAVIGMNNATFAAQGGVNTLNSVMFSLYGAAGAVDRQLEDLRNELLKVSGAAGSAAGSMTLLGSIAEATSFKFSSLSVNIGPFNLALRNILVQLPAILTGMGTLLALVTSLATAFLTLGAGLSAVVAGGALVFFEDFNKQFEETSEAIQALTSALLDLFKDAIEPLMTDANMDLFIDSIDYAAKLVNRFSQFFAQMKDDILAFTEGVGADIDILFEALHDSFVMLMPILQDILNWFIRGFPAALMTFTRLTENISDDLGMLMFAFGDLLFQLLEFAQTLIGSVAPILFVIVEGLSSLFNILNSVNDAVISLFIQWLALTAVWHSATARVMQLIGGMAKLHSVLIAHAASGGMLANVYHSLTQAVIYHRAQEQGLAETYATVRKQLARNIAATEYSIGQKWKAIKSNVSLTASYLGLSGALSTATGAATAFWTALTGGSLPAIAAVIGAIIVVIGAIMHFDSVVSIVSSTIGFFTDILKGLAKLLATLVIPTLNLYLVPLQVMLSLIDSLVGVVASLVDGFLKMVGVSEGLNTVGNIFQRILKTIDKANDLVGFLIEQLNRLPGIDIEGPAIDPKKVRSQISGESEEAAKDDIQTESKVDLSFMDKVEQNVDVQADPEDSAQLSRITKDAIEEANSFARRQQGGSG